jgi:hypothetical protein
MNPTKYVVKHAKCGDYIAERAGTMARWAGREEAMSMTKEEWEAELSPSFNRELIEFEAEAV